jgi:dihydrofolate reductase
VIFRDDEKKDALLLGRKTYDIFAEYWPNAPEEIPFTQLLNRIPKYVASNTLKEPLTWHGASVVAGDLAAGIAAIKDRHDEVQVIGSLDLVQSLLRLGLVDRLNLWVYPVLLGTGKRLFADGTVPVTLQLAASEIYDNGLAHLTYELVGAPTYDNMADVVTSNL